MFKKTLVFAALMMTILYQSSFAMDTSYYNDGLSKENIAKGYQLAKSIPNASVIMKKAGNSDNSRFKAVGYIKNMNGWAGKNIEVMGTGFVINKHTILTNAHVIDDEKGRATQAKYLTFMMNRDGSQVDYRLSIKDVKKIPYADLAVLHTKVNLAQYVQPLNLATDDQILSLRKGTPLYSVGYPYHGTDDFTTRYWNQAMFLSLSSNRTELMLKDKFRAGASGSPLVDRNFNVYGVRTYSHKLFGVNDDRYGKVELAGAESLYGYLGLQVLNYSY